MVVVGYVAVLAEMCVFEGRGAHGGLVETLVVFEARSGGLKRCRTALPLLGEDMIL